ncbi:MAG: Dolichyl-phosphate-mannose-protein mannosyltransferase [Candidatus Amesbacteria bacterium GW2011_GWB1_47_19]|nr:MAG: Dolichyl-phosphate-mannose-protein mannosyltransferase [Candidatus Amesbacteria bacterium GW2011_GWA1_44_24]KKU31575.1 MAG: Dolichyl-phosphate-mannose-protein mannosyltransferase [Candidatus Amesbacteria bacterium GW2011_GWC1_46_24]KKU67348.1 MAG: Dolichyl-phosphate-mannose-protein mannosyltransferase [Candidatus Amesbacteria bacterium GW2011_GWB1_47_19]OGD05237.1 MAG: hypothetical protein A2379_04490 [Candidatus Amesbacteria bacterium RIFOXYB1_FULL_47_13]HBC72602.1 hypothetical protein
MFSLALFIGLYSYGVFFLGIIGWLTRPDIFLFTLIWLILLIIYILKIDFKPARPAGGFQINNLKLDSLSRLFLLLIFLQLLINLIGALGPELGFDALWYHLTLPKLWLSEGFLKFYPGPINKYSVMPMLTELLYIPAVALGSAVWAKLIHYSFGILTLFVTYRLSRKFLTVRYSLLAVLIMSSNLVFSWQQATAYIDLARTFFESLALLLFLENKFYKSAVSLGLAACTKLLALGSLPIYWILLWYQKRSVKYAIYYLLITVILISPWLLRSYLATGNPVYPFFSPMLDETSISLNPLDIWRLFISSSDPVNPIHLIVLPLVFPQFLRLKLKLRLVSVYCLLSLLVWWLTPRTGGGRFILPYLPAFSVLTAIIIFELRDKFIRNFLIYLSLILSIISISYRFAANTKYLPVIFGLQSRQDFLSKNLNFSFGDYTDTDNYLTAILHPSDKIAVLGINNLFYIPIAHITDDVSGADYLLIRYTDSDFAPDSSWMLLHENPLTHTRLYRHP